MSPLAGRFAEVGAPPLLAKVWVPASLLRDGFALTAAGDKQAFAHIGAEVLRGLLPARDLSMGVEEAVEHIMAGLAGLKLHPDVPGGVRALKNAGYRLATLTNGSAETAETLFTDGGIRDHFDVLLSVEDAPAWKPAPASDHYASRVWEFRPTVAAGGGTPLGYSRCCTGRLAYRLAQPHGRTVPRVFLDA